VTESHQLVSRRRQTSDTVAQEPEREPMQELVSAGALDESPAVDWQPQPASDLSAACSQPASGLPASEPEEEGPSCYEVLERLVTCNWLTREEAENLRQLPYEQLCTDLQEFVNFVVAVVKESD
jgi:hypothetical protein